MIRSLFDQVGDTAVQPAASSQPRAIHTVKSIVLVRAALFETQRAVDVGGLAHTGVAWYWRMVLLRSRR